MRSRLYNLIPILFIDYFARLIGWLYSFIKPSAGYGMERRVRGVYWGTRLKTSGLHIGRDVQIETPDKISVGKNSKLFCTSHYVAGRNGFIRIGSNTHIGRHSLVSGFAGVTIGDRTAISSHFVVYSSSNDVFAKDLVSSPNIKSTVSIGSDVFIGTSVTVLPGVTIGNGAVIGAGSLVMQDVPAGMIAAGSPIKIIRQKN